MSEAKVLAPGITMQWNVMSGTPVLQETRIPPWCIAAYFMRGGQSVDKIARNYRLPKKAVEDAIRYEYNLKLSGKRRPRARRPKQEADRG